MTMTELCAWTEESAISGRSLVVVVPTDAGLREPNSASRFSKLAELQSVGGSIFLDNSETAVSATVAVPAMSMPWMWSFILSSLVCTESRVM
jgi:hypothetical protein